MNTRIKELATQAGLQAYYEAQEGQIEKFAELIVQECMSCASFVGITNDRIGLGPMPIRYTSMVNDQIKKHFGVKE